MKRWTWMWVTVCCAMLGALPLHADVVISAAISLKPALEKTKPELEKAAGEPVTFNFGASGTLAGQIRQGAPVDLFISADRMNVDKLVQDKAGEKGTERAIAGNEVVLVAAILPDEKRPTLKEFSDVTKVTKLAIGEPKVVPAGAYAKEVLTYLKLWDTLEKVNKLVTAENVAQVLSFVERGEVDAGIVYATDAKNSQKVRVVATADAAMHTPIEYVSVIVTASKQHAAAVKTQEALIGENVQNTLHDFGFTKPMAATAKSNG